MTWSETTVLVVLIIALALWIGFTSARRLDRLHRKVVSSRLALDAQLLRRASAAYDLASSGLFDPASSVLLAETSKSIVSLGADGDLELAAALPDLSALIEEHRKSTASGPAPRAVVYSALDIGLGYDRADRESTLTSVITELLDDESSTAQLYSDPFARDLLDALAKAWYRVQIARRFHNESVLQAQRVRSKRWIRIFHIAGHAAMPQTVEFNDSWPDGLKPAGLGAPSTDNELEIK